MSKLYQLCVAVVFLVGLSEQTVEAYPTNCFEDVEDYKKFFGGYLKRRCEKTENNECFCSENFQFDPNYHYKNYRKIYAISTTRTKRYFHKNELSKYQSITVKNLTEKLIEQLETNKINTQYCLSVKVFTRATSNFNYQISVYFLSKNQYESFKFAIYAIKRTISDAYPRYIFRNLLQFKEERIPIECNSKNLTDPDIHSSPNSSASQNHSPKTLFAEDQYVYGTKIQLLNSSLTHQTMGSLFNRTDFLECLNSFLEKHLHQSNLAQTIHSIRFWALSDPENFEIVIALDRHPNDTIILEYSHLLTSLFNKTFCETYFVDSSPPPIGLATKLISYVDICSSNQTNCSQHAHCTNYPGYYRCYCNANYQGDGKICKLADPCKSDQCPSDQGCAHFAGKYICIARSVSKKYKNALMGTFAVFVTAFVVTLIKLIRRK